MFTVVLPLLESFQNPPGSSQGVIPMTQALPDFAYSGKLLSSFPVKHLNPKQHQIAPLWHSRERTGYSLNTPWPKEERGLVRDEGWGGEEQKSRA